MDPLMDSLKLINHSTELKDGHQYIMRLPNKHPFIWKIGTYSIASREFKTPNGSISWGRIVDCFELPVSMDDVFHGATSPHEDQCDECGALIPTTEHEVINNKHLESCSCHPKNTV